MLLSYTGHQERTWCCWGDSGQSPEGEGESEASVGLASAEALGWEGAEMSQEQEVWLE